MIPKYTLVILSICLSIKSFSQNALSAQMIVTNLSEANLGSIYVHVNGGNPPYHFKWNHTNDTSSVLQNLEAGTYLVTIKDANGLTQSVSESIRMVRNGENKSDELYKVTTAIEYELIVVQAQQLLSKNLMVNLLDSLNNIIMSKNVLAGSTICFMQTDQLYEGNYGIQLIDDTKIYSYPVLIHRN
jgi:hypothetical protein